MREINSRLIEDTVYDLALQACTVLPVETEQLLKDAYSCEESPFGRESLRQLIENAAIARNEKMPMCQDTGMAIIFIEIGQDVHITGDPLKACINEGVRRAYRDGYFRKSVLDPLTRINTKDNTPAVIHTEIVTGDKIKISFAPKGFGSENMSALCMLTPSAGIDGVKDFIINTVIKAGSNPCPPIVLGVGIGGTMELCALMAKKALIRPCGTHNQDNKVAELEIELLEKINKLGIGPQGLGGTVTALAVHIDTYPTHIAGLPVAVNMQCHACRHSEAII